MDMDYLNLSKNELIILSKSPISLEDAISKTYGKILYDMENFDVLPNLEYLLSSKHNYVVPFILNFYHLTSNEFNKVKDMVSEKESSWELTSVMRIKNTEIVNFSEIKNTLGDFLQEINNEKVDVFSKKSLSPLDVANLIINKNASPLNHDYDTDFLKEVISNLDKEHYYDSEFFRKFVFHCINVDMKKGKIPSFSDVEFSCLEKRIFNSSVDYMDRANYNAEEIAYLDSKEFAINKLNNWVDKNQLYVDLPKSCNKLGFNSKEVKEAVKKIFGVLSAESLNSIDFRVLSCFQKNRSLNSKINGDSKFYREFISDIGEDEARLIFNNLLPALWTQEDFKKKEIDSLVKEMFFDKSNMLVSDALRLLKDSNKEYFFSEEFLDFFAKKINWSSLDSNCYIHLSDLIQKNVLDLFISAIEYSHKNDIPLCLNEASSHIPIHKIISSSSLKKKFDYNKDYDISLDKLGNLEWLWTYEQSFDLFSYVSFNFMDDELEMMQKHNPLTKFLYKHFVMKPTVDKFLIVKNMQLMNNNTLLKCVLPEMLSKLNPIDVKIIKEFEYDSALLSVVGDATAPIGTAENCCYRRANFFSKKNAKISETLFGSVRFSFKPKLAETLLNNDEQLLDSTMILKMLNGMKSLNQYDESLSQFVIDYSKKFPDFIKVTNDNRKIIHSLPLLSDFFSEKKDFVYSYDYLMKTSELINKLTLEKKYEDVDVLKNEFQDLPINLKNSLIDQYLESMDWKNKPLSLLGGIHNSSFNLKMINQQIFFNYPDDFHLVPEIKKEIVFLNLIKEARQKKLNVNQMKFLLSIGETESHYYHNLGKTDVWLDDNLKLMKDVILNEGFDYLIVYPQITKLLDLTNDDIFKAYSKMAVNLNSEKAINILVNLNKVERKNIVFPKGEQSLINLVKSVAKLPTINQFLFVITVAEILKEQSEFNQICELNLMKKFVPKDIREEYTFSRNGTKTALSLISFFPELSDVEKLKNNRELLSYYVNLIKELGQSDMEEVNTKELIIDSTSGNIFLLGDTENKVITVETFVDALYFNKKIEVAESFKSGFHAGLNKMIEFNIYNVSDYFLINKENFFEVISSLKRLKDMDDDLKKSGTRGKRAAEEITNFSEIANQIKNQLLSNEFSQEQVKLLQFAIHGAMFNAKINSETMSCAEYAVFLNRNLISTVGVVSKKMSIHNLFDRNINIHVDDADSDCDNSFKI